MYILGGQFWKSTLKLIRNEYIRLVHALAKATIEHLLFVLRGHLPFRGQLPKWLVDKIVT